MKQFARCTHCRQWYARYVMTTVEVVRGNGLQGTTLWCMRCIQDTERRSQVIEAQAGEQAQPTVAVALHSQGPVQDPAVSTEFAVLVQEHLDLMERALHEDDASIVRLIKAFAQRCRSYQAQLDEPEQAERLTRHLHYWEAFLKAMHAVAQNEPCEQKSISRETLSPMMQE